MTLHVETPPGACICPRCAKKDSLFSGLSEVRTVEPKPIRPIPLSECECSWCRQHEAVKTKTFGSWLASQWLEMWR